ncbi:MAG: hypothetical protein ACJAQ3_003543, partial [Planctomycetota bacterium]
PSPPGSAGAASTSGPLIEWQYRPAQTYAILCNGDGSLVGGFSYDSATKVHSLQRPT